MIINWTQDRILGIPVIENKEKVARIQLLPGNNEVDDALWQKARGMVQDKLKAKTLIEVTKLEEIAGEDPKAPKVWKSTPFKKLPGGEAEKIVSDTYNLKTLEAWKDGESRDSVRLAIQKRIDEVMKVKGPKSDK